MDIESLCREVEQAKSDRSNFDTYFQEIAENIIPRYGDFTSKITKGEKLQQKIYDSTPTLALDRFASAMESMIVPQNTIWHRLRASDRDLMKLHAVKKYFDELNLVLAHYRTRSRFQAQSHEHFIQIGAFGSGGLAVMPHPKRKGIYYKSLPLSRWWFRENEMGEVDTGYRQMDWTAQQAEARWGYDALPYRLQKDIDSGKHNQYEFYQVIKPRTDRDPMRRDAKGKPFMSVIYCREDKTLMEEGGFDSFPVPTSRFVTSAGETYGRSPGMTALADVKTLHEMSKTILRAGHMATQPPLLLHDDMQGMPIRMTPNALNFGGVNSDGRQMIQPLSSGANPGIGDALIQQRRESINQIFFVSLFQIMVDGPNRMTATEVIERTREKGQLLAPVMGRQQYELLAPMIERELDILESQGVLPEIPPELSEAGSDYDIVYDSPLSRAQQAEQAAGLFRTLEGITPFSQLDPSILGRFDSDQIMVDLADINAMPERWMKSDDQMSAERERQAMQEQAAQLLQAAPIVQDVRKSEAELQQIAQAGPAGRV